MRVEDQIISKIDAVGDAMHVRLDDFGQRMDGFETSLDKQEDWLKEIETGFNAERHRGMRRGAWKRDTSLGGITDEQWSEERWLRGFLLASAPDDSYRAQGKSLMQEICPGRFEKWLTEQREADQQKAVLTSSADLVPVPVFSEVLAEAAEQQTVRHVSRFVQILGGELRLPKINTDFTAALVAENAVFPAAAGTYTSQLISTIKFGGLDAITLELIEDSAVPVATDFFLRLIQKSNELENAQALEGDGVGNNFIGVLNATGVNAVALGAAPTNLDPFFEMVTSINAPDINPNFCRWFMSKEGARKILQIKEGTTNAPMVQRDGRLQEFLGYRVILTEQIDNTRGAGTNETTIYWGNFQRGMVIGQHGAEHLDTSISATTTVWNQGQVGVRYFRRVALGVVLPSLFVKGTGMTV